MAFNAILKLIASPSVCAREKVGGGGGERDRQTDRQKDSERDKERQRETERQRQRESWENLK